MNQKFIQRFTKTIWRCQCEDSRCWVTRISL